MRFIKHILLTALLCMAQSVTWSVQSGALPPGVSLSADGQLTGTPTAAGSYTFTLAAQSTGATPATREFTVVIDAADPAPTPEPTPTPTATVEITTTTLPGGKVGVAYVAALAATVTGQPPPDPEPSNGVTIVKPAPGETVSGKYSIEAAITVPIAGLTFFVDGAAASLRQQTAPWDDGLDTTRWPDGEHSLTAVADLPGGQTVTSPALLFKILNATAQTPTTPPPPPTPIPGPIVSPDGNKWNVSTTAELKAVLGSTSVQPGDTILIKGGKYTGVFTCTIKGTEAKPIVVRPAPGEIATLDGNGNPLNIPVIEIGSRDNKQSCEYVWFMGLEVMNSNTNAGDSTNTTNCPAGRCHGIFTYQAKGVRVINNIIHDNALGIGAWIPSTDMEIYGNLIYYNGWQGTDRGHGHGIYTQNNRPSKKWVEENIVFAQFDNGVQVYTGGGSLANPSYIDDYLVRGNISFQNGALSTKIADKNLLVGGGLTAKNPRVLENMTYYPPATQIGENTFGYRADTGWDGGELANNYLVGGRQLLFIKGAQPSIHGNITYGNELIGPFTNFPDNDWRKYSTNAALDQRPQLNAVFVRPNKYEPGRANIAIYNWENLPAVQVPLQASGLVMGQAFEVRDALNFLAAPVLTGTYNGTPIVLPMQGLTPVKPIGAQAKTFLHTAPAFGVFVVIPR